MFFEWGRNSIINNMKMHKLFYVFLMVLYIIFLYKLIDNSKSLENFLIIFFVFSCCCVLFIKRIYLNIYLIFMLLSCFLFIAMNEYFFQDRYFFTDVEIGNFFKNFMAIMLLLFVPTMIIYTKFREHSLIFLFVMINIFSVYTHLYWNINLDFDRNLLNERFGPIIIYDYTVIALSLISIPLFLNIKNKWSYVLIALCLINIFLVICHGSRGSWIALPFIFLFLFIMFYKEKYKILFMVCLSSLLLAVIFTLPNSPMIKRLNHAQNEIEQISNHDAQLNSTSSRIEMWKIALDSGMEAPFFGIGQQKLNYKIYENIKIKQPHAHNIFVNEFGAHGVMGLLALLIFIFMPLFYFLRNLKYNRIVCCSGVILAVYSIFCGLTDYIFITLYGTAFYFLMVSTFITLVEVRKIKDSLIK